MILFFWTAPRLQYLNFLPHLLALLKPGGMLVSDNVLYQGMIASNELVVRRKITIVKRLRKYLQAISNPPPACIHSASHWRRRGGFLLKK